MSLFSSLDALIFSSPEPQTIDFQLEINFKHALNFRQAFIVGSIQNTTTLEKISNFLSQINERIGQAAAWLTTILMLLICFNVTTRYLFNSSDAWRTELEWHLFALIFLLGAGYALKHDKHVRVDLFYAKFSEKQKAIVNFIGTFVFLLPWCAVIIYASYKYAHSSWMMNEGSPDNGLPARYLIKFAITTGFALLFLQAIALLLKSLNTIISGSKQ